MSLARAGWIAATFAAIAFACTSFDEPQSSAPPDGDDGGTDGGVADGSPSGPDANVGDAVAEADGDAGSCAPVRSACDGGYVHQFDFTSNEIPPNLFVAGLDNGTVTHDASSGHCAPGLAHAVAAVPDGGKAEAYFYRNVTGPFKTARLAFSFRGPRARLQSYLNFGCDFVLRNSAAVTARSSLLMSLSNDTLQLFGSVRDENNDAIPTPDASVTLDNSVDDTEAATWRTVDARLDIGATKIVVSGTFDGAPFTTFEIPLTQPVGRVGLECGIMYADQSAVTHELDLDDVLLEVCP